MLQAGVSRLSVAPCVGPCRLRADVLALGSSLWPVFGAAGVSPYAEPINGNDLLIGSIEALRKARLVDALEIELIE